MEEQQAAPQGAKSGLTREEQMAKIMPVLRHMMPNIIAVGQMYNKTYPMDKTLPEVLDAVTVAVPLRQFMVMSGMCTVLIAEVIEKETQAAAAAARVG